MKRQRITRWMMASLLGLMGMAPAEILVGLDPEDALYDSDVKGIVNDQGNGPGTAGNQSGVPLIENAGEHTHAAGFTFHVEFTPVASDLAGTRSLIELGGTSNGSGLYLIGGVPTLLSKQGASATTTPESLDDRVLNSIAVQSTIGVLEAGARYSFSASWNHEGTLELLAAPDGGGEIFNSFTIVGVPGNWSGNDTLTVKTLPPNNPGGLARDTTNAIDPRFNTNSPTVTSFAGEVHRAIFWNAHDVTPPVLSEPVVKGFTVTRLPASGKLRLHWNISEGGLPNPTTAEIRETGVTGGDPLHTITPETLIGFVDLETPAASLTLEAVNANGSVSATAVPEQETAYSAVVRAASPLAWYRFNETTGSRHLVDSAENETPNDGEVLGDLIAGGTGFLDGAGNFGGSATVLNREILNPGSIEPEAPKGFTVEAVVKHQAGSTGNQVIVAQQDVEGGTGRVIIGLRADGTLYSFLGNGNRDSTVKLPADTWSHVALVVDPDGGQFRWYVNGQSAGIITPSEGYTLESSTGGWVIGSGKNLASTFYKGSLDEIAVYPSLLDDPDRNGDFSDSLVPGHHQAWYQFTKGILRFEGTADSVVTGASFDLVAYVGSDVTAATIDNGIGEVTIDANGNAIVTGISPTATTTYTLTATGPGVSYTSTFTVIYNQLTAPVILGFEATSLPSPDGVEPDRVRLHWAATAGDFDTPVTVKLTWGTDGLFESTSLRGFHDIPATEATSLKIEVTNFIGSVDLAGTAPAPDTAHSAVIRAANPVAWYRFNEAVSSGLIVDSANNEAPHNGVLRNHIAVNLGAAGFLDGAGTFNNAGAILTDRIIDPEDLDFLGFTVEAIVETNPGTGTANRILVSQQDQVATGRQILSVDDTGVARSNVGGGTTLYSTGKLPPRAWSHLVGTVDLITNEVRWYIDGQFAGSGTSSTFFEPSQGAWVIGSNKTLDGNFWRGKIDDLIVYDRVLADSEILAHRDAWWDRTSGLLYAGPETATIDPGGEVNLSIKVGADVTGVSIDPGTSVPIDGGAPGSVRGTAVVTLNPSQTTTYTITYQTPSGPVTKTITVTVNGGASAPLEVIAHRIQDGNFIIEFKGAPSTTYAVKGSEDLASFPIDHGTVTTDDLGTGTAVIVIDPAKTKEFFRIELPN